MAELQDLIHLRGEIRWPPQLRKRRRDYSSGEVRDSQGISIAEEAKARKVSQQNIYRVFCALNSILAYPQIERLIAVQR